MTESASREHAESTPQPPLHGPIPVPSPVAIGLGVIVIALAVSAQTFLSMLQHGHSFGRILLWQLGDWACWGLAAPFVLRSGARFAVAPRRDWRDSFHLLAIGVLLLIVHGILTTLFTVWLQPFAPSAAYTFTHAFVNQLPYRSATDLLLYVLLLVVGGALAAHHRARDLTLRKSRLEAELARAELRALRLEIEPHFLFNTLNAIAALIRLKDNAKALEMVVGLGDFMRHNLDDQRDQFVPLSTEIEWIKRYVGLQQMRFGERLEVEYRIDQESLNVAVPTLLLQPLVENALRHGAARQTDRCRIVIGATPDAHHLTLRIADDGAGLPANFDVDRQAGTGLRNTRSRLEQIYGSAATLEMLRGTPAGTTVLVRLPLSAARWQGRATA